MIEVQKMNCAVYLFKDEIPEYNVLIDNVVLIGSSDTPVIEAWVEGGLKMIDCTLYKPEGLSFWKSPFTSICLRYLRWRHNGRERVD